MTLQEMADRMEAARMTAGWIEREIERPEMPAGLRRSLTELMAELRRRGGIGLTRKQQIRELRRADPANPEYWTNKQKARALRKADGQGAMTGNGG